MVFVAIKSGKHILVRNCWCFSMVVQKYIINFLWWLCQVIICLFFQTSLNCHDLDNALSGIPDQFKSWQVWYKNDSFGCMWMLKRIPYCGILRMVSFFAIFSLAMEPSRDESALLGIKATIFIGWSSLTSDQNHFAIRMSIRVVFKWIVWEYFDN